jgi:hypothetical protein
VLEVFGQSLMVSVLAGPAAGAAFLLSERDAKLVGRGGVGQKKDL